MKAWLKGGIVGLLIPIAWWVWASVSEGCLLEFGELLNVGGANCGWHVSFLTNFNNFLIIFGIPTLIGLGIGALIGWVVGRKKEVAK